MSPAFARLEDEEMFTRLEDEEIFNYEYRVVTVHELGIDGIKFYDYTAAFAFYRDMKEQFPDAFVTIQMREMW